MILPSLKLTASSWENVGWKTRITPVLDFLSVVALQEEGEWRWTAWCHDVHDELTHFPWQQIALFKIQFSAQNFPNYYRQSNIQTLEEQTADITTSNNTTGLGRHAYYVYAVWVFCCVFLSWFVLVLIVIIIAFFFKYSRRVSMLKLHCEFKWGISCCYNVSRYVRLNKTMIYPAWN